MKWKSRMIFLTTKNVYMFRISESGEIKLLLLFLKTSTNDGQQFFATQ